MTTMQQQPSDKTAPWLSVLVPVYNVADLLSRCVDSLLAQTYEDVRIILVDDGSTDDCPAICDQYAEQDPRVTSLHRTNGGLSAARNTGIDHVFSIEEPSRGRYIAFVDSDDWVEPGYVESMLETLEESGAGLVLLVSGVALLGSAAFPLVLAELAAKDKPQG